MQKVDVTFANLLGYYLFEILPISCFEKTSKNVKDGCF